MHSDPCIVGASLEAEKQFEIQYPAVYSHLLKHKKELSNRNKAETGIRYEWYALQRWGANYWDDFNRQKIVWKRIGSILRFSYDETGALPLDSTCIATGEHIKYLVALLNSNMGKYLLRNSPQTGTGDLIISVQAVGPLYIPKPDQKSESMIDNMVDTLLDHSKIEPAFFQKIQSQVNSIIYGLYMLDDEEIEFIDSLSRNP